MTKYDEVISFNSEEAGILLEVIGETYSELRLQKISAEELGDHDMVNVLTQMMDDIKPIYDRLAGVDEEE
jgi:hypothetical protein